MSWRDMNPLPEKGWKGYGAPGYMSDAEKAVRALRDNVALVRCEHYRLQDTLMTRAHQGPALFAEFELLRGCPHGREALEREVTSALAYIAMVMPR